MRELHILNLGGGIQSTTLYLMFLTQELTELTQELDCAIFADTSAEAEPVNRHLEWLTSVCGPCNLFRSRGDLSDDLNDGLDPGFNLFDSVPVHTTDVPGCPKGMMCGQCARDYKLSVIIQTIRELLRLGPRQPFPSRKVAVNLYLAVSYDQQSRAESIQRRWAEFRWVKPVFPLIERKMTQRHCRRWLREYGKVPHPVPRSGCVFCPYRSNKDWRWLRKHDPAGFQRAVEIDGALRGESLIPGQYNRFLHRSCLPLAEADLDAPESREEHAVLGFNRECEGMCGL